jgi:DNA-binding PadR family transcriptional regulator
LTELSLQVLLALGGGAAHGYAIGKDIEERSGGRLDPTTGSLYQALKRLTDEGLIRQVAAPKGLEGDQRRKYFALTPHGRAAAADEIRRLEDIVLIGRRRQLYRAGAR